MSDEAIKIHIEELKRKVPTLIWRYVNSKLVPYYAGLTLRNSRLMVAVYLSQEIPGGYVAHRLSSSGARVRAYGKDPAEAVLHSLQEVPIDD